MDIIKEAIFESVKENSQSESLAKAINAWFIALASGNETIGDEDSVKRRLDIILKQTYEED